MLITTIFSFSHIGFFNPMEDQFNGLSDIELSSAKKF